MMPNLRDIRDHIQSVRSISKVTNAMEVVATARAHRLRARVEATRPFYEHSWEVLNHLIAASDPEIAENRMFCGYAQPERIAIILITSNRGMVGGNDLTVVSMAERLIDRIRASVGVTDLTPVARVVLDGFEQEEFHQVQLAYSQYRPGARMKATMRQLLPVCPSDTEGRRTYIYEPEPEQLLDMLLPRIIRFQIYEALLEGLAAENTALMIAMQSATQNANELVNDLSVSYHKARQENITTELMDILGGTSALGKE
jgi:F-type H+-transporting ATPase subunit gamma